MGAADMDGTVTCSYVLMHRNGCWGGSEGPKWQHFTGDLTRLGGWGFPKEVVLELSSEETFRGVCREERAGWLGLGSEEKKGALTRPRRPCKGCFCPRWTGSLFEVWETYSRKTTPGCDMGERCQEHCGVDKMMFVREAGGLVRPWRGSTGRAWR